MANSFNYEKDPDLIVERTSSGHHVGSYTYDVACSRFGKAFVDRVKAASKSVREPSILSYIINRLDNTTAWIGAIGLVLLLFRLHGVLAFLFVALFFIPEGSFSEIFKGWTKSLKDIDHD